mgnify:CR=1 FL=1
MIRFRLIISFPHSLFLSFLVTVLRRLLSLQNIGFDSRGALQLFDFGLCRELTPILPKAIGIIGTVRFVFTNTIESLSLSCARASFCRIRLPHIAFRNLPTVFLFPLLLFKTLFYR